MKEYKRKKQIKTQHPYERVEKELIKAGQLNIKTPTCFLPPLLLASLLTLVSNSNNEKFSSTLPITLEEIQAYSLKDLLSPNISYPYNETEYSDDIETNELVTDEDMSAWENYQAQLRDWKRHEQEGNILFQCYFSKTLFNLLDQYVHAYQSNKLNKIYFDTQRKSFFPINVNVPEASISSARRLLTIYRRKFGNSFALPFLEETKNFLPEDRIWEAVWILKTKNLLYMEDGLIHLTEDFSPLYRKEPIHNTNNIYSLFSIKEKENEDVIYYKDSPLKLPPQQHTILIILIQQQGKVAASKILRSIKTTKQYMWEDNDEDNEDYYADEVSRKWGLTDHSKRPSHNTKIPWNTILRPAISRVNAALKKYKIKVHLKNGYVFLDK